MTNWRIKLRGPREGLFFIDKRLLDRSWRFVGRRLVEPGARELRSDGPGDGGAAGPGLVTGVTPGGSLARKQPRL